MGYLDIYFYCKREGTFDVEVDLNFDIPSQQYTKHIEFVFNKRCGPKSIKFHEVINKLEKLIIFPAQ